jgi:MarR family transcriptional regulator for hemolysin
MTADDRIAGEAGDPDAIGRLARGLGKASRVAAADSVTIALENLSTVSVTGTHFLELEGRHPAGSLEDMKLKFTRRVIFVARRWRNRINDELRKTGHSHARWMTLMWIHLLGGQANHRELAERIGVELPTLIRLLNRLEAEGLVERCALEGPGRAKTVRLTSAGKPVLAELNVITERARADFLRGVDKDKLEICLSVLDDLLTNASED